MNVFKSDLAFSHAAHRLPFWEERFYPACFPDFVRREVREADGSDQRDGVDCVVHLTQSCSGVPRMKLVDEKVRRQLYFDVLLEVWSDYGRRVPGWANPAKALRCEFIAYANLLTGRALFLPVQALHRAFRLNGDRWLEENKSSSRPEGLLFAQNRSWKTGNVSVAVDDLLRCIADASVIHFSPCFGMHKDGEEGARAEIRCKAECAADVEWRKGGRVGFAPRPDDDDVEGWKVFVKRHTGVQL